MRKTKKILGILLSCIMLLSMLSVGAVAADGSQADPIDAATKWFGYGVDTYLLNPTIAEGSDGMWYTLTADKEGVLFLEHSYKNVDYTIYVTLNGVVYEGGCVDGEPYNRPIVTAPVKVGDVATIQIATKDAAAGTVYASMNIVSGDLDSAIKVKSNGLSVVIGAGKTVYFQDDSLNAIYATKGLLVEGDVSDITFYTVSKNGESGTATEKPFTDVDADGVIEVKLGGSLGSAGAPAVKPAWAIKNNSGEDRTFTLTIVSAVHECQGKNACDTVCGTCSAPVTAGEHTYDNDADVDCNVCGAVREVEEPEIVYGDANGDGAVNAIDALMLQQYVAGWEVDGLDMTSSDANGDDAVNAIDALLLQQYVAGWEVTLGPEEESKEFNDGELSDWP